VATPNPCSTDIVNAVGNKPKKSWYRRLGVMIPLAFLTAGVIVAVAAYVSPWPSALLIRALFEQDAQKTVDEMDKYVPATGVDARLNLEYGKTGSDPAFDLFTPTGTTGQLPTVVWIHGGAWISGSKENVDPYARILASHGYTVVALDYTVAPEAIYPTALMQLNAALGYLVDNARDLNIDPDRIVLAGDSAGSNLASQLAIVATSPDYADLLGMQPALTPEQLRGLVLNCGIYDVSGIPNAPGIGGWGFRVALWAYLGDKDWAHTPGGEEMSTLDAVTADFPATWISGGNADPLTETQSKPMAAKLNGLGVDVTELFYPADTEPGLPHEYQFHLDYSNAQLALQSTLAFLQRVTE
jgi:acetyl esterase/lipase